MDEIMLLIEHEKNRFLLQNFLKKNYKIEVPEDNKVKIETNVDLVIADDLALRKYRPLIGEVKNKRQPIFFPVLLITARRENVKQEYFYELIDEYVEVPIKKIEFKTRVENLLMIRRFSRESEHRYNTLAENSPVGICIMQDKKIMYANPALIKIIGKSRDELVGNNFLKLIDPQDREEVINYYQKDVSSKELPGSFEVRCLREGEECWIDLRMSNISYKGKNCKLLMVMDVTERKKAEERINYLSFHDQLTGLYNRAYFTEEMKRLNTERQLPISIIIGDINGLKLVNDAFGHQTGDKLLKKSARIFKSCCRKEDIIARWGGDEFGILLPQTKEEDAEKVCTRIKESCEHVTEPVELNIALGAATKTEARQKIKSVLKKADDRMYRNKLREEESVRDTIIYSLEETLRETTHETQEHINRMQNLATNLGEKVGLTSSELDELNLLVRLHDIGKVGVPDSILDKSEELKPKEWENVKKHPQIGYNILKSVPKLARISEGVLCHHEWWDGSGYPQGLKREEIPFLSRITAIIESYEAMTSERSYQEEISHAEALKELKEGAGTQFDPQLVEVFTKMMEEEYNE